MRVEIDRGDVEKVKRLLKGVEKDINKVLSRGINKTVIPARNYASRKIRTRLNLKAGTVKSFLRHKKSSQRDLSSYFAALKKPVPLYQYGARQTKKGVSVKVLKTGSREVVERAFIPTGRQVVFQRTYQGPKKRGVNINYAKLPKKFRYPIKPLYGPSVGSGMERNENMKTILIFTGNKLSFNLQQALDAVLRGY